MTDLKLVPQPEGYELRDKRSDKTNKASDWEVQDALYDASQQCMRVDVKALLVLYFEVDAEGNKYVRRHYAGPADQGLELMIAGLGSEMGWNKG
jgi:hypothetical protein